MHLNRRSLVAWAGSSLAASSLPALAQSASATPQPNPNAPPWHNVRHYGATGDGSTIDSPAINRAIEAASALGGGTVYFPAGTYASYSIRLKSSITLFLEQGATILAAPVPHDGLATGGYDAAEPQGPWEPYQDYGHNHWHNSLIWGEGLQDIAILGMGLIWGRGLSRGWDTETALPDTTKPGVANKAIALKNCVNVTLRDFGILQGGWFGLLATGVDNLTVDNLVIDTNRDGMDFDCCRNVRVSNTTVNSPWDDGICPKSSFALGYARPTENLTITNCLVTGHYQLGTVMDGSWKPIPADQKPYRTGRIKCGTESNGGFKNITISNCVFDHCHGFELVSQDGAICEDITLSNIAMRSVIAAPLFLRLGSRMRGPAGTPVGSIKRVLFSNIVSSSATLSPSVFSGIPNHPIQDIKISNVYFQHIPDDRPAPTNPPEREAAYPEPEMFGPLPATGFYLRHLQNIEVSNLEIALDPTSSSHPTLPAITLPAVTLQDVNGADFFRLRLPRSTPAFQLNQVTDFRHFGSQFLSDFSSPSISGQPLTLP